MQETSKCHQPRLERGDFDKYLRGNGIDIGAGDDPLKVPQGTVRAWDQADGDAQAMAGVPDNTYDFVYSSHCLEHMWDVPETLRNWIRILKPRGHLYVVVPDYILYEKLTWPSRFNGDHKQSFSNVIIRHLVARPNHWHMENDLFPLLRSLAVDVVFWGLESWDFNFNAGRFDQTREGAAAQLCFVAIKRG